MNSPIFLGPFTVSPPKQIDKYAFFILALNFILSINLIRAYILIPVVLRS
jgi:hypothetical protein